MWKFSDSHPGTSQSASSGGGGTGRLALTQVFAWPRFCYSPRKSHVLQVSEDSNCPKKAFSWVGVTHSGSSTSVSWAGQNALSCQLSPFKKAHLNSTTPHML